MHGDHPPVEFDCRRRARREVARVVEAREAILIHDATRVGRHRGTYGQRCVEIDDAHRDAPASVVAPHHIGRHEVRVDDAGTLVQPRDAVDKSVAVGSVKVGGGWPLRRILEARAEAGEREWAHAISKAVTVPPRRRIWKADDPSDWQDSGEGRVRCIDHSTRGTH